MKQQNMNLFFKKGWMLFFVALILASCSETADYSHLTDISGGSPFDPSKPIEVTDFMPKKGGVGTRLIVYGNNFGNDTTKLRVTIGGKAAPVINTLGTSLLCMVPEKAFTGDIQVSVVDDNAQPVATGECADKFEYQRRWTVSTFLGKTLEDNTKYETKEGPFEDCGAFENTYFMRFNPKDSDMLYITCSTSPTRIIDFKNRYVYFFTTNLDRVNGIDFTKNGDIVMTRNQESDSQTGLYMFTKESGYTERLELCNGRTAQAPSVHPVDGRVYWSQYRSGQIYSYDVETGEKRTVCSLPYTREACYIVWHPTGKYCYLMFVQHHCIYRADYNEEEKTLDPPYRVVGMDSKWGYADGVGSSARVNTPEQGVFVYNPEYAGNDDEYDFYFCDEKNHCVRYLTPSGRVYTYAGRSDGGPEGYRDGDLRKEALFSHPMAISYDYKRHCFYIGDNGNHFIRRIGLEE